MRGKAVHRELLDIVSVHQKELCDVEGAYQREARPRFGLDLFIHSDQFERALRKRTRVVTVATVVFAEGLQPGRCPKLG